VASAARVIEAGGNESFAGVFFDLGFFLTSAVGPFAFVLRFAVCLGATTGFFLDLRADGFWRREDFSSGERHFPTSRYQRRQRWRMK
jgi:hypothetical protein